MLAKLFPFPLYDYSKNYGSVGKYVGSGTRRNPSDFWGGLDPYDLEGHSLCVAFNVGAPRVRICVGESHPQRGMMELDCPVCFARDGLRSL